MSLVSHLEEFRKRLVACIICFFAAVLICLGQAAWLTERLMEKAQGFQFVYIAPTELVLSYVRLALTGGVSLACPVMLYQIWGFIRPGLTRRERQSCFVILTFGMLLFLIYHSGFNCLPPPRFLPIPGLNRKLFPGGRCVPGYSFLNRWTETQICPGLPGIHRMPYYHLGIRVALSRDFIRFLFFIISQAFSSNLPPAFRSVKSGTVPPDNPVHSLRGRRGESDQDKYS